MIDHLVLFKWKKDVSVASIDEIEAQLRSLKDQIPGIVALTAGRNFSPRGQGYQSALLVRLKDRAALDAYAVHPAHVAVVQTFVQPSLEHIIVADYES